MSSRYLLDTHVLLWWLLSPKKIDAHVAKVIADERNAVWFSAASVWEVAIKRQLGKLNVPAGIEQAAVDANFTELSIASSHAAELETLPDHHRDPFDRMLIAQARREGLTLVTVDEKIVRYPVVTLMAG